MRDKLPRRINLKETRIVNLDDKHHEGTHWAAYIKDIDNVVYFHSYGSLKPPTELVKYFNSSGNSNIYYT